MTRREAERVAALMEDVARPGDELPPVGETDAVAAFDAWLRAAPPAGRLVFRALLRLPARGPLATLREPLVRLAAHCYYGDDEVMRRLGYDPDAVVARATAVRLAEGRP
jgi:hypothetical protein